MKDYESKLPIVAKQGSSTDEHESKCERCGVGCHATINLNGHDLVVEGLHCKFLTDKGEGPVENVGRGRFHCSVYENRMEVAPWCGHSDYAVDKGWLRKGCPYAVEAGFSSGKERVKPEFYENLWPHIFAEVVNTNWHDHVTYQSFLEKHVIPREGEGWTIIPGDIPGTIAFERTDDND